MSQPDQSNNQQAKPPEWHVERLTMFERDVLRKLDGTANGGFEPAGEYRAHLAQELAKIRGHLASYGVTR